MEASNQQSSSIMANQKQPVGNAAVMLEAIETALTTIRGIINGTIARTNNSVFDCRDKLKAALALPRRNCDVGTAEEQEKRWHKNCGPGIPNCKHCKVYGQAKESGFVSGRGFLLSCSCKFVWAQMPYEEGDAK